MRRLPYIVAVVLGIVVLRGRSIFTPFSDPTAGLYLHIGKAWLDGHLPYTTNWDYRPPGYFGLYAVAIALFGASLARDALAIAALASTAIATAMIANRALPSAVPSVGYWAAAFFVMLSPTNDGGAGVAELQISAFIALAIVASLNLSVVSACIAGLAAGMAIQCKLSAVPLAIVPVALIAMHARHAIGRSIAFLVCFATPIIADILVYARADQIGALWDANIGASIRRIGDSRSAIEFARNRGNFLRQLFELAPEAEFAIIGLSWQANRVYLATIGWLVASATSIVLAGEFYERQFVLMAAPVAVLAALGFDRVMNRLGTAALRRWTAVLTVILTFALHDYFESNQTLAYSLHRLVLRDHDWRLDQTSALERALHCLPNGGRNLLLFEQSPFIYDLVGADAPKYAYSDHLLDPRLSRLAGIDGTAELRRLLESRPERIVVSNLKDFRYESIRVRLIKNTIGSQYRLEMRTAQFFIYRRADETPFADEHACIRSSG